MSYNDSSSDGSDVKEVVRLVQMNFGIFLLILGTCGNVLAFIVLRQKALRVHAIFFLLSVLAICDLTCLYFGLLNKVVEYFVGFDVFRTTNTYLCSIQVFILYTSLQYASWLLVLVTAERFIAVWFHQKYRQLCTVFNAKIASLVTLFILAAINFHFLFTAGVTIQTNADPERTHEVVSQRDGQQGDSSINQTVPASGSRGGSLSYVIANYSGEMGEESMKVCDAKSPFEHFLFSVWPYVDLSIFCFIPFFIMFVINVLIAYRLFYADAGYSGGKLHGTTAIMFTCCFSFFILTLPISIYLIARPTDTSSTKPNVQLIMYTVWMVVNLLQYTNNAINFYLYCLSGAQFRRELVRLLQLWKGKLQSWCCCCCQSRFGKLPNDEFYPEQYASKTESKSTKYRHDGVLTCFHRRSDNRRQEFPLNTRSKIPSPENSLKNPPIITVTREDAPPPQNSAADSKATNIEQCLADFGATDNTMGDDVLAVKPAKALGKNKTDGKRRKLDKGMADPSRVMSTLFDSEANSGGASAFSMMASVIKEEQSSKEDIDEDGGDDEDDAMLAPKLPDTDDAFGAAIQPASAYHLHNRRYQHLFQAFGPMC